jgi:hypothetical protein
MASMEEPPPILDGCRVVEYAILDRSRTASSRISTVVEGVTVDLATVAGLVVTENLAAEGHFLLHCNERWETLAAGHHPDAATARDFAARAYAGVPIPWTPYRELSAEEAAEVASTRAFLRDLARDFPGE